MSTDAPADTSQDISAEEDIDEEYLPWLADVAKECPYKVKVLEEEDKHTMLSLLVLLQPDSTLKQNDDSHVGYVRCKAVRLPDPLDVVEKKVPRQYELRRYSTVLVLAGPEEPPYIGLIDKIWRKASARPAGDASDEYFAVDLYIECYWFYRQAELPSTAWTSLRREKKMPIDIKGAQHKLTNKHKPVYESASVRQVLFSSHHTQHDAAQDNPQGWINLSAVLQTCEMHWLGLKGRIPDKYVIHADKLIRTRQPGYAVQGFLWCNSRNRPQLSPQYKRAFPLDGSWNDQETADIVAVMQRRYRATVAKMEQQNKSIIEEYRRSKQSQQLQQQQQQQQHPAVAGRAEQQSFKQQAGAHPQKQQQVQQLQKHSLMRLRRTAVSSGHDTSTDPEENVALVDRMQGMSDS